MKYGWSFQKKFFFFVIKVQIIIFFPPFVDELNGNPFFQFGCSIQWGVKSLKSLLLSLWGFPYCLEAAWSMNKLKEMVKKKCWNWIISFYLWVCRVLNRQNLNDRLDDDFKSNLRPGWRHLGGGKGRNTSNFLILGFEAALFWLRCVF